MSKILRWGRAHKYSIYQILRVLTAGMMILFAVTGCKNDVGRVDLTGITVTPPSKLTYNVGEELNTEGMVVTATYSDETTKDVTAEAILSGYDKTKAGEQTVTVSYTEEEVTAQTSYTVTVKAIELTKIEITNQPTKKEYFVGATQLDLTGLKVTATYTDGTTPDVTDKVTTSGFNSTVAVESQTITVTYGGKTATFTVKINPVLFTGISITTQPTKKDYHIGDEIDLTGMVVTANYNDGSTKTLELTEYTVSGFDSTAYVNDKEITVTYNETTTTFTINVVFNWYETPVQLSDDTGGTYGTEGTYVWFGVWPQDVVPEADVAGLGLETPTDKETRGYMEFVQGTDGNYYVKHESKWYKVMPIKWRVFYEAYDVDGDTGSETGKLLVAENILTANVPYYEDSENNRTIDGKIVYPNNYMHSQIRAYLNGNTYTGYDTSTSSNIEKSQWQGKGFLQTAFTNEAINKIITTKVDNSEEQMSYNGTNDIEDEYACDPTDDKIFLLSEYEVTKYSKSTETYNSNGQGNSRIRVTTDFAKANNAKQSTTNGYGGYYWLRSPSYSSSIRACNVGLDGNASFKYNVFGSDRGVVPALSISF